MTWLASTLYALGVVGAASAVSRGPDGRYVPTGLREYVVIICWPLAVGAALGLGLFTFVRRGWRP
ncbi:hypothetical protein GGQ99_001322 [Aminobacter niigataensis]|uniref:Uncharacterized protein n=1 Tax=Aminobacter niigataensis TaxID=83265 RepID=A0ABR6KYT0_9HYPH|nr:hypothetical protein [Aminobacter niigataensis]